jgi:hypothetical protein
MGQRCVTRQEMDMSREMQLWGPWLIMAAWVLDGAHAGTGWNDVIAGVVLTTLGTARRCSTLFAKPAQF